MAKNPELFSAEKPSLKTKLPLNQIVCGDAFEVLKDWPEECVDMVMFSPPYWGLRDYKIPKVDDVFAVGALGIETHPRLYVERMVILCHLIKRILKRSGSLWVNIGDTYFGSGIHDIDNGAKSRARSLNWKNDFVEPKEKGWSKIRDGKWLRSKQLLSLPERIVIKLQEDGWLLRNKCIWHKRNCMPFSGRDRLKSTWEYLFFFTKQEKYYFDLDSVLKPFSFSALQRYKRPYRSQKTQYYAGMSRENQSKTSLKALEGKIKGVNPGDFFDMGTQTAHHEHIAAYPEQLCKLPIQSSCPKDGLVLDPMCGSGTTCLVAWNLGRNYIGIDLNPHYVEIAKKRLGNQTRLDGES